MAGKYTRKNWVNDETKLNADNMNNIEDGIEEALANASTAQSAAESAQSSANKALQENKNLNDSFDEYKEKADNAQTSADAAQTSANEAKSAADKALEENQTQQQSIEALLERINNFSSTFIGTRSEYEAAYLEGKIPVGTLVVITDEDDSTGNNSNSDKLIKAILGTGTLGKLILGKS